MASILPHQNLPTNNSYGIFNSKPIAQTENAPKNNKFKNFTVNSTFPVGGALGGTGVGYLIYDAKINTKLRKIKATPEYQKLNKLLIGFKELLNDYSEEKEEKLGLIFGEPLELKKDPLERNEDLKKFADVLEESKQEAVGWSSDAIVKSFKKKLLIIGAIGGFTIGGVALGIKYLVSLKKQAGAEDAHNNN